MTDPNLYFVIASASLAGLGMLTFAGLSGFRAWLDLKRQELQMDHDHAAPAPAGAGARIEIADLKERIRKLEAIAAGVDL